MNIVSLFRGLATLSWMAVIGALAFGVFRAARGGGFRGAATMVAVALVAAIVLTTASAGLVFVQPAERGVVVSALQPRGYRDQALTPGLRWIIPYAENVVLYPISRQTYTMSIASREGQVEGDDSIAARTSDGQEVFIDASVIFSLDPLRVVDVHINWQNRYIDDLIRPQVRGVIRGAVSQFGVEEVYSLRREALREQIQVELASVMAENGLTLDSFVLRNITFTAEYAASIEQKQIAEQQAQQAKFVVEQRRQEAEQARQQAKGIADAEVLKATGDAEAQVIRAEAEAQALELIAEQLRDNPELITFRYVEKLGPGIQVMLVPSENPFLLPLPGFTPAPVTGSSPH